VSNQGEVSQARGRIMTRGDMVSVGYEAAEWFSGQALLPMGNAESADIRGEVKFDPRITGLWAQMTKRLGD
jgi:hypothetical protein